MQHQNFALVLRAFTEMFDRLSPAQRSQVEEMLRRILSRLQDLVLTTELDEALLTLAATLDTAGGAGDRGGGLGSPPEGEEQYPGPR